jgi:CHAT domain-containing protein
MQTAQRALADLSQRVWRPVNATFTNAPGVRRLRIAPDGALNLVPFEALSDGRDLIDRFTISYVPAGRDLLERETARARSGPVVVVSPGPVAARIPIVSAPGTGPGDALAPLANVDSEAADVRRLLPRTSVYRGDAATERRVKALRGPAVLHVIGHGVVRGSADCGTPPCLSPALDASTQAMSLAAIVLEEAYGRGVGSSDDGLLTALELQNMNLRGTEMLVLSQCQMASGLPSVGEGVYGMRRAAALAGVQTFVAPLWNVDDAAQQRLMKRFYEGLAAGETRADALRRAKLALRRDPATSSFLYWAPVILSGAPDRLPASLFR